MCIFNSYGVSFSSKVSLCSTCLTLMNREVYCLVGVSPILMGLGGSLYNYFLWHICLLLEVCSFLSLVESQWWSLIQLFEWEHETKKSWNNGSETGTWPLKVICNKFSGYFPIIFYSFISVISAITLWNFDVGNFQKLTLGDGRETSIRYF